MAFSSDPVFWIGVSYFKFILSCFFSNQNSIAQVPDTREKQVDELIHPEAFFGEIFITKRDGFQQ